MTRVSPLGAATRRVGKRRKEHVALAGVARPCPVLCVASRRMNSVTCWVDKLVQVVPLAPEQAAMKRCVVGRWRKRVASAAPITSRRLVSVARDPEGGSRYVVSMPGTSKMLLVRTRDP
jgi:hypothetical protein